jgi:hypothetical protein
MEGVFFFAPIMRLSGSRAHAGDWQGTLGGETLFRLTVSRRRTGFMTEYPGTGYPGKGPKFMSEKIRA